MKFGMIVQWLQEAHQADGTYIILYNILMLITSDDV